MIFPPKIGALNGLSFSILDHVGFSRRLQWKAYLWVLDESLFKRLREEKLGAEELSPDESCWELVSNSDG